MRRQTRVLGGTAFAVVTMCIDPPPAVGRPYLSLGCSPPKVDETPGQNAKQQGRSSHWDAINTAYCRDRNHAARRAMQCVAPLQGARGCSRFRSWDFIPGYGLARLQRARRRRNGEATVIAGQHCVRPRELAH